MQVLIVAKTTNLERHGERLRRRVESGHLGNEYLLQLEQAHREHYHTIDELRHALDRRKIEFVEVGRGLYWPSLENFDAVITVGGDGTVLEASHHILNDSIPLIGIRSSSYSVGHLCSYAADSLELGIRHLEQRTLNLARVSRMKAEISYRMSGGAQTTDPVLNDFLFCNPSPAVTSRYKLIINGEEEEQRSSGVWLATGAGSTAAIFAAGGSVHPMESEGFQYLVRELYRPVANEAKFSRGLISPKSFSQFVIENRMNKAMLAIDGQHGRISLSFGDQVKIGMAEPLMLARS